jgi:hypothetical protein
MGNGSGPGGFNSRIYTNSWSYQGQRQFYPEYARQYGNSFYGLSVPQYQSTMYYTLSNNGPSAGARINRGGNRGQADFNNTTFKLYYNKPYFV